MNLVSQQRNTALEKLIYFTNMVNTMNQKNIVSNTSLNKKITPEQFEQIVEAIIAGKYSWACVLLLRCAGHNPLHYIPYRTYNRLIKENCQVGRASRHKTDSINTGNQCTETRSDGTSSQGCLGRISDLGYLEAVGEQQTQLGGGTLEQWLGDKIREYSSLQVVDLVEHKIKDNLLATNKFIS